MNKVKGGEKSREASCSTAALQILIRTHWFAFGIQWNHKHSQFDCTRIIKLIGISHSICCNVVGLFLLRREQLKTLSRVYNQHQYKTNEGLTVNWHFAQLSRFLVRCLSVKQMPTRHQLWSSDTVEVWWEWFLKNLEVKYSRKC